MILFFFILAVLAMAFAALRWGVDTRDDINSLEWERRKTWRGRW